MKKLRNLIAVMTILGLSPLMTGCGGDDDDHADDPQLPAAPASLAGRTVTVAVAGENPEDYTFEADGQSFVVYQAGTDNIILGGTYSYSPSANTAQLNLTQTGAEAPTVLNMVFTSPSAGTFTGTRADGVAISGTFSNLRQTGGGPVDPGNGGTTTGTTVGDTTVGTGTGAPASLAGRTIDFAAPGAGVENIQFQTATTAVSDIEGPATYTYTRTGDNTGTVNIQWPSGSRYDLNMNFATDRTGTWSGNQFYDGRDNPVPGGSTFTVQN
jgi:hypothetical protein